MACDIAWPWAPIALAGLLAEFRRGGPGTVGSDPSTGEAGPTTGGGAWPVSRRGRFMDWTLIRHIPLFC